MFNCGDISECRLTRRCQAASGERPPSTLWVAEQTSPQWPRTIPTPPRLWLEMQKPWCSVKEICRATTKCGLRSQTSGTLRHKMRAFSSCAITDCAFYLSQRAHSTVWDCASRQLLGKKRQSAEEQLKVAFSGRLTCCSTVLSSCSIVRSKRWVTSGHQYRLVKPRVTSRQLTSAQTVRQNWRTPGCRLMSFRHGISPPSSNSTLTAMCSLFSAIRHFPKTRLRPAASVRKELAMMSARFPSS